MRAIRIDVDGVTEIDLADDFIETSDIDGDCFRLNDNHDVWGDDEGLFADHPDLAHVGPNRDTPLPAYVLGAVGERTVDATMTVEHARTLVSNVRRDVKLTFGITSG